MDKSQVSLEFLFAVGVIFFVFLIIFGFMINRNIELSNSIIDIEKDNDCLFVSSLMTSAFVAGSGVVINHSISYKANISLTNLNVAYKGLNVDGSYCFLSVHTVPSEKLQKGNVRMENRNGYVDIENV